MLYRTTRGKHDVVTAFKTVHTDCYGDGGLFLPFRMPKLNRSQIESMARSSSAQIIADVLNALFGFDLTAWDVELAVGRRPVSIVTIGRRLIAGELWRGADGGLEAKVQALSDRLGGYGQAPTNWVRIAVYISLIFAQYGMASSAGAIRSSEKLDIAVATGDFSMPIAAWYAREMGLPIGNILCGSNANGFFWDLLNHGELPTGATAVTTCTPQADMVVPRDLERLIHGVFDVDECKRYLLCCDRRETYTLTEEALARLSGGLFAAVTSDSRMRAVISAVCRSRGYILSPYAALAYGSLQDFRATTGEENQTLLLCDRSPMQDGALVSRVLKIKPTELEKRLAK